MKLFNSHLSFEKIADAIDNRLPASEQSSFQAHLESCPHCQTEYKTLAHSINLMRSDNSADAPPEALSFAANLFRARKQFEPRETSVVGKILATLKLDVSPFAPVFGERSAAVSSERQMLFEAGDFDLDLRVRANENDFNVVGQILGELSGRVSIRLQNEKFESETNASEIGEFKIGNVQAGKYDLTLKIGDLEIVINNLKLE